MPTIKNMDSTYSNQIHTYRTSPPTLTGEGWEVRPANGNARGVAYMGYVAYPIDWSIMYNKMPLTQSTRALFELLRANNITLFFNIGEVSFVNNREGLEYTEETITILSTRIQQIFNKIKDSIQEKFQSLPNIWEAKKMYNSIFGTGMLDVERGESEDVIERVRILDGNLMKLEQTFQGAFRWNDITIDSPYFRKINRFDNNLSTIMGDEHTPASPVMVTYRKKKLRVKVNRCKDESNNGIVASVHVAVVINDTGLRTGVQQVARYLIFKENSKIKTVHFLRFENDSLKDLFYRAYNFDSVPVLKLSELIGPAREWTKTNKVSRSYGGGGGGARVMRYINVENGSVEESEVPIREMENGGYFVKMSDYRKQIVLGDNYGTVFPESITGEFKTIADKLGIELDRVYIIPKQTGEAKWFKQAVESGDWICVWDYLKENLSVLDSVLLINTKYYNENSIIGEETARKIGPKLYNEKSMFFNLIKIVTTQDFEGNIALVNALEALHLWDDFTKNAEGTIDFDKVSEKILKTYPILSEYNGLHYDNVDDEDFVKIVNYINAMDLWLDLNPRPLVKLEKKETA